MIARHASVFPLEKHNRDDGTHDKRAAADGEGKEDALAPRALRAGGFGGGHGAAV
jgi:hypothetical protein